jgi:hypothetical protein
MIHTTITATDTSDSQRLVETSWNHWLIPRLRTMPAVFAKRCPNMSMNAFAWYFSVGVVGT